MTHRSARTIAGFLAVCAVGMSFVLTAAPSQALQVTPAVDETFTGATADPRFVAFGSACLTGASRGDTPPAGEHELTGCDTDQIGPVPPGDGAPFGYLQLTDAKNDQAGAVLFNTPIPAAGGLDVTFEQWQYGNRSVVPADGIVFFLTDGDAQLTAPGAFGGSLGYAQKLPDDNPDLEFLPGVDNGYLGIGLDVLGNYFGDWEQRGNGCETRSPAGTEFRFPAPGPNMVTVRGPGDGLTGYCWLTATTSNTTTTPPWPSTLPGALHGDLQELPPDVTAEEAQELLEPVKRTVRVQVTPAPDPVVTVEIDFQDGAGLQEVLSFAAPEPAPAHYKFGFAASTGLFTDVHLIRNVAVSSIEPVEASLDLTKLVDPDTIPAGGLRPGDEIVYVYEVTNTGQAMVDDLAVTDSLADPVTCTVTTLAPDETATCEATYTITRGDRRRGSVTNAATATGTRVDTGEAVVSGTSSVTVTICDCHKKPDKDKKPDKSQGKKPDRKPEPWHDVWWR